MTHLWAESIIFLYFEENMFFGRELNVFFKKILFIATTSLKKHQFPLVQPRYAQQWV